MIALAIVAVVAFAAGATYGEHYGRRCERRLCELEPQLAAMEVALAAEDARRPSLGEENGNPRHVPPRPFLRGPR
jgi:hypothetical protein